MSTPATDLKAIFGQALEIEPAEQRAAFLEMACEAAQHVLAATGLGMPEALGGVDERLDGRARRPFEFAADRRTTSDPSGLRSTRQDQIISQH